MVDAVKQIIPTGHKILHWVIFGVGVLVFAGIVYLVHFKPPNFIKIPGTNTVINMQTATQDIKNKLQQLDTLDKKINQLQLQLQQVQDQLNQNITSAQKQTDVRKSMEDIQKHW